MDDEMITTLYVEWDIDVESTQAGVSILVPIITK
jgi:hypothetical protein